MGDQIGQEGRLAGLEKGFGNSQPGWLASARRNYVYSLITANFGQKSGRKSGPFSRADF
jgi:hypothetical protein